jgi:ubiquinone/menaquinone biosynthesis C-methylase UbiE
MPYVCGHSAREMDRLAIQATVYEDITRDLLLRAGVGPAMQVLDIGCGAGDVSLLAARLVGPAGRVLGVDHASEAVAVARARAERAGVANVAFYAGEIAGFAPDAPVDALVGRFVLMHQPDPAALLGAAARHVRPGGVVAFVESHMSGSVPGVHSWPHSPTYDRVVRWQTDTIRAAGSRTDMGLALGPAFLAAGLPAPDLRLEARVEGGPDASIYRYIAESLRSMLPLAEQFGIARLAPQEIDRLEQELRAEVTGAGGVLVSPLVVAAWCRVP